MGLVIDTSALVEWERNGYGLGGILEPSTQMIPQNDMEVAATARAYQMDVLIGPNDEAHFRRVLNLGVIVIGQ